MCVKNGRVSQPSARGTRSSEADFALFHEGWDVRVSKKRRAWLWMRVRAWRELDWRFRVCEETYDSTVLSVKESVAGFDGCDEGEGWRCGEYD